MSDERTPPWLIQLRFFLLCSPVGIIAAILLAPFALPVLLGFGLTLFLFWQGARLFTNTFVWLFDPATYHEMKRRGYDPFYNSLGSPLNNDTEAVRLQGLIPNQMCPECFEPVVIQPNVNTVCPNCNAHWHNNRWWTWTGSAWAEISS